MFGFGPCTFKKKTSKKNVAEVATTSFFKVNIQIDPKFNGQVTPYIEYMLLYW